MRYLLALLLSACVVQDSLNTQDCWESACAPNWANDCRCPRGAIMELVPNGVVICRCHTGTRDGG